MRVLCAGYPLHRENRENAIWQKRNPCQGKHREIGNFAKTQGSNLTKTLFAAKFPNFVLRTECVCQVSFAYEPSSDH